MTVYILRERRSQQIVFCGRTSDPLRLQLSRHVADARRGDDGPLSQVIRSTGRPRIECVVEVDDERVADVVVEAWRAFCAALGFPILQTDETARRQRRAPTATTN